MKSSFEETARIIRAITRTSTLTVLLPLLATTLTAVAYAIFVYPATTRTTDLLFIFFIASAVLAAAMTARSYVRTVATRPTSLSIALIGPASAGKTVYLTMLFKELEHAEQKELKFTAYGSATIEVVQHDLSRMRSGKWPYPTPPGADFRYEALAIYTPKLSQHRYRIEITDYAGEHLDVFYPGSAGYAKRDSFFDTVVHADAVIMMIDCERILFYKDRYQTDPIPEVEAKLISALQELIERRNHDPLEKSEIPIVLILSMSDLVKTEAARDNALDRLSMLLTVCSNRFRFFNLYFTSSIGTTPEMGSDGLPVPPQILRPSRVVEPISWILGT